MIKFILNDKTIETDLPKGTTVLDFARYYKNLKGTKIGCREGDCGACTIMVGELNDEKVKYRTQTSCLMPIANAQGKHIVTIEGINKPDGELTAVQGAMVEESGTQCGFCTVGFVMSLTNFCVDDTPKTIDSAVSAIDGNICRCTGYKSIERACGRICETIKAEEIYPQINTDKHGLENEGENPRVSKGVNLGNLHSAIANEIVPEYFASIVERLNEISDFKSQISNSENHESLTPNPKFISGGTDLYVQRPEEMVHTDAENLFDSSDLRLINETDEFIEIGASTVVTDLLESEAFNRLFPNLYKHLKLVSSTPIRNMATIAGNFVNASPIGDMTAWFLALDAEIELSSLSEPSAVADGLSLNTRTVLLKDFYLGYKKLAKTEDEFISKIRFRKDFTHFNFEKVCKRTYLDIASVNTAISLKMSGEQIENAHISIGGVFATPLYLRKTSEFLNGKEISLETINEAAEILQTEIAPISDVRGSESYKRLLARQLFMAHFVELFGINN